MRRRGGQYYEGYSLTRAELLFFVAQDQERISDRLAAYPQVAEVVFRTVRGPGSDDPVPHPTAP